VALARETLQTPASWAFLNASIEVPANFGQPKAQDFADGGYKTLCSFY
jgi:hypothetical protein